MILYHGSNVEIKNPELNHSRIALDFGPCFYTTSDFDQAKRWAVRVSKIRESETPIVSVFEIDQDILNGLSILRFEKADSGWLKTVVGFRIDHPIAQGYDIITGPVANDRTVDVINQFIAGTFPEDIALRLLLPMQFKDQWTFKTQKAISALLYREAIRL